MAGRNGFDQARGSLYSSARLLDDIQIVSKGPTAMAGR